MSLCGKAHISQVTCIQTCLESLATVRQEQEAKNGMQVLIKSDKQLLWYASFRDRNHHISARLPLEISFQKGSQDTVICLSVCDLKFTCHYFPKLLSCGCS